MAQAQTKWTLTTADFQSRQVDLASIDESGARVSDAAGGNARLVKWDDLLLLDRGADAARPATPPTTAGAASRFVLTLTSGDQVRGEPLRLEGDTLRWKSPAGGEINIPL
ncbi:MAG TPA: hypothetical protein VER17_00440, partial [Tepidisphaeraceae bacterium]|nr:hypothetical protein [Tepidisphaeraceae bacterium]